MTKLEQVQACVKANPGCNATAIAAATGIARDTVRTCINTLIGRGDIVSTRSGRTSTYRATAALKPNNRQPIAAR